MIFNPSIRYHTKEQLSVQELERREETQLCVLGWTVSESGEETELETMNERDPDGDIEEEFEFKHRRVGW